MRRIALLTSDDATLAHGEAADAHAVAAVHTVARHVERACLELGWSVVPVCVTRDPRRLLADLEHARPDAAFHLAESVGGDARMEAAVAMLLEWIGMPYTGSPPEALTHSLDKPVARALLAAHGVPVAAGVVLEHGDESLAGLEPPWIVKPAREDASHGIHLESVVSDEAAARRLRARVDPALPPTGARRGVRRGARAQRRAARTAHGSRRRCRSSRSTSPDFPAGRPKLVTYAAKWHPASDEYRGTRSIPARDLEPALARRVIETACAAYRALELRGYGRIDLRLAGDGHLIVVDVNPNPDLGPDEVLARAAERAGIGYTSLIEWLVDQALGKPGGPAISRDA